MWTMPSMPRRGPRRLGQPSAPRQWVRTFVREWRVYRDLTIEELAAAAGMSIGNLSGLENRRSGYSPEGLERLAKALRTTPGALLTVNPQEPGGRFWELWEAAGPQERETLTIMAERLVKTRLQ